MYIIFVGLLCGDQLGIFPMEYFHGEGEVEGDQLFLEGVKITQIGFEGNTGLSL